MTKFALDLVSNRIKADVRLHNLDVIQDDMAIIFVMNHFTRLETILLPYEIHKHTGKEVWGLAAAELFEGRLGSYLRSVCTVSTKDPDRDKIIVHTLLNGRHPWMIFPEGSMIKDKKVINEAGDFEIYSHGIRRAPHTGAAVLALRAEFYRHKLRCLYERPKQEGLTEALQRFDLPDFEESLNKRTVIIPVNITYFPIRAQENFLVRMAQKFSGGELSPRALEELSVEGTVLGQGTDIDVTLGEPIDVREYLNAPDYAEIMACGINDMEALEDDATSMFNDAARKLMLRYMDAIYQNTTVNYDHIFATLIRHQPNRGFTERAYRNRIFLSAHLIRHLGQYRMHRLLENTYKQVVYEDPSDKFQNFVGICLKEEVLRQDGHQYFKNHKDVNPPSDFHTARFEELTEVIANELEPLSQATEIVKQVARMPRFLLSKRIRDIFIKEDQRIFEEDYARCYNPELSKGPDVGRPFLLKPMRVKAGIVLAHGYMAAPLEIRAMAEFFYAKGYAVYGVRLRGHGTSPEDLAQSQWEDWYESVNRGYAVIKSLTDNIILGGFSTGGCLALMAAANKGVKVQSVFSVCAPLQVRNYSIRLAPSLVSINSLLKRIGRGVDTFEFVENVPENAHINYTRNPLTGVRELVQVMGKMEAILAEVTIPTLIVQASKDTVVHPSSAQQIFDKVGATYKEMIMLERDRHGIVNGAGREDVFEHVLHFIERAPKHATMDAAEHVDAAEQQEDEAAAAS